MRQRNETFESYIKLMRAMIVQDVMGLFDPVTIRLTREPKQKTQIEFLRTQGERLSRVNMRESLRSATPMIRQFGEFMLACSRQMDILLDVISEDFRELNLTDFSDKYLLQLRKPTKYRKCIERRKTIYFQVEKRDALLRFGEIVKVEAR